MMSMVSKTIASLSDAKNSKIGLRCHAGCSDEFEVTMRRSTFKVERVVLNSLLAKNGSASSEAFHARSRTFLTLTLKRADVLHPQLEGETLEAFTRIELSNGKSAPLLFLEGFYLAGHSIALAIGFHGVDLVVIGGLRL